MNLVVFASKDGGSGGGGSIAVQPLSGRDTIKTPFHKHTNTEKKSLEGL